MLIQPAPNFGAAGNHLAAPYSLDFSKDQQQVVPLEGTWQGSRKRGQSLYIDNFNNNMSITVSSGNYVNKVPPYSAAYLDLRGLDEVLLTADSNGFCTGKLATQAAQDQIISRGNSPASVLSYPKTVNLTTSNTAMYVCYSPETNYIYVLSYTGLILWLDPVSLKVVGSIQFVTSSHITGGEYIGGKIFFATTVGFYLYNIAANTFTTINSDISESGAKYIYRFDYSPKENAVYYVKVTSSTSVYALCTFKVDTTKAYAETVVTIPSGNYPASVMYCPDDNFMYVGMRSSTTSNAFVERVSNGVVQAGNVVLDPSGSQGGLACMIYCPVTRTIYGTPWSSTTWIYSLSIDSFVSAGAKKITPQGPSNSSTITGAFSRNTKQVYMSSMDIIDPVLNGSAGLLPSLASGDVFYSASWVDNINMVAIGTSKGLINFIG